MKSAARSNGITIMALVQIAKNPAMLAGGVNHHVCFHLDTHILKGVDFLLDDGLGQTKFGDAVDQHAAREMEHLEDGDLVALLCQISGASEPRRAGALVAVGFGLYGFFPDVCYVPVRREAFQASDGNYMTGATPLSVVGCPAYSAFGW